MSFAVVGWNASSKFPVDLAWFDSREDANKYALTQEGFHDPVSVLEGDTNQVRATWEAYCKMHGKDFSLETESV